eukprot:Hpha_TRINITY_DN34015_c0_g1::TRINITY_DN34015_c0_g1_i1::g.30606::m.30606
MKAVLALLAVGVVGGRLRHERYDAAKPTPPPFSLTEHELQRMALDAPRLPFRPDGLFRILTVTDAHFNTKCRQVPNERKRNCDGRNTTQFLDRILEVDGPFDLVVYIGDAIDQACRVRGVWITDPETKVRTRHLSGFNASVCMDMIYGWAWRNGLPWAATLGNHDDDVRHWTKWKIVEHLETLPRSLTRTGPKALAGDRPGNFHIDLVGARPGRDSEEVLFRTFHMMGDVTSEATYTTGQVTWARQLMGQLTKRAAVPSFMFGHIALPEFRKAAAEGNVSGHWEERIGAPHANNGLFDVIHEGGAVAMFSGHDHLNDFCAELAGIQLCYCGAPGYGGYGRRTPHYHRRTRVLEIRGWGREVRSWLRLDDAAMSVQSNETLWSADAPPDHRHRTPGRLQPRPQLVAWVQAQQAVKS